MQLKQLIEPLSPISISGETHLVVKDLQFDSRKASQGSLFVAIKGTQVDGHQYIDKAIEQGAVAIVCEILPEKREATVTYIRVPNSAKALGELSSQFFGHPSSKLKLVGITGTNGKTTTATLAYQLFESMGFKCGLLSTVENKIAGQVIAATHTTPNAVAINQLLATMADAACDYVFMEVSSHAIDQERIAGLQFAGGVFTNISHDHLDYHKTFKAYIEAKKKFFDLLPTTAFALTNLDDPRGKIMVQNTKAEIATYGLRAMTDFKARILENSLMGLHLELDGMDFYTRLIGGFNAYNLLAVYAIGILLDQEKLEVLTALSAIKGAEGRFEYLVDHENRIGIVDYAHTPDALDKVLDTIQELKADSTVIALVGCGGDRDAAKRPKMAKVAVTKSDLVVLTSDNPRSEDPLAIIEDMKTGLEREDKVKVLTIPERREAIEKAVHLARPGDIILIAGKGHEKYQEIKGVKYPFDDKEILKEAFALK